MILGRVACSTRKHFVLTAVVCEGCRTSAMNVSGGAAVGSLVGHSASGKFLQAFIMLTCLAFLNWRFIEIFGRVACICPSFVNDIVKFRDI